MCRELALLICPQPEQAQVMGWLEDDGFEVECLPSVVGLGSRVRGTRPALVVAGPLGRRERALVLRAASCGGHPALVFLGSPQEGEPGAWPHTPASTAAELCHAVVWAFAAREARAGWNAPLEQGFAQLAAVAAASTVPARGIDALVDACARALGARAAFVALASAPTGALRLPPLSERPAPSGAALKVLSRAVERRLPTWQLCEDERGQVELFATPVALADEVLGAIAWERDGQAPLGRGALRLACAATDLICLELDRHRLADLLERRNRLAAMGELLAGIAQEIDAPASDLHLNLSALEGLRQRGHLASSDEVDLGSLIADCLAGAEQIASLAASLDTTAQRPRRAGRAVELCDVAKRAASLVRAQPRPGPAIRVEAEDAAPVLGDPGRLLHVALSLVAHAAQAAGPRGHLVVRTGAGEGTSFLEVEGEGIGALPRVGDRASELGLALGRRIVEELGGELTPRSRPGLAAAFRLSLPAICAPVALSESLRALAARGEPEQVARRRRHRFGAAAHKSVAPPVR